MNNQTNNANDLDGEEASWQNIQGYYGNLSRLMHELTLQELRQNQYQMWLVLRNIFGWTGAYFKEKANTKIEQQLKDIKNLITQQAHEATYNNQKAQQTGNKIEEALYQAKKEIVNEMKNANLLIGTREKGSDLYN